MFQFKRCGDVVTTYQLFYKKCLKFKIFIIFVHHKVA
jgi:hypothetical protein